MKIGILTAARTNNNGTDLQALAMQYSFSQFCDSVEIINYKCDRLENSHKIIPSLSIKNIVMIPIRIYNNISHHLFRKSLNFSKQTYDKNSIDSINYDKVVVGSDQIWNLNITGNDLNFFLPFEFGGKKYSYAASLGKTNICKWQDKYNLKSYLKSFEKISVREYSGVTALDEIGVSSQWNLDPLLLVNSEIWKTKCKITQPKKPYVFVYDVESNAKALHYAQKYAKENNLELVVYSCRIKPIKGARVIRFLSINKFLSLINNAKMVITNSYHGLSMAINFNKNFRAFKLSNSIQSNSRMLNLLENLDLNDFLITNEEKNESPNWGNVNAKLSKLRETSFDYIKEICDYK